MDGAVEKQDVGIVAFCDLVCGRFQFLVVHALNITSAIAIWPLLLQSRSESCWLFSFSAAWPLRSNRARTRLTVTTSRDPSAYCTVPPFALHASAAQDDSYNRGVTQQRYPPGAV